MPSPIFFAADLQLSIERARSRGNNIAAQNAEPLPRLSLSEPSNVSALASVVERGRDIRVAVRRLILRSPKIYYRQRTYGIFPRSTRQSTFQMWILSALRRLAVLLLQHGDNFISRTQ